MNDLDREGGYIKLYRRLRSSPVWAALRGDQRSVLIELLFLANWKPASASWHGRLFEVGRGELAHTLATIAEAAGVGVAVARSAVAVLLADHGNGPFLQERYPFPNTGPHTGPRVLKIVNYDRYQGSDSEDSHSLSHRPRTDLAQREEGEEGEEEKQQGGGQPLLVVSPPSEKPRPEPSTKTGRRIRELWPDVPDPDGLLHRLHRAYPAVDLPQAVEDAWVWEAAQPASGRKKAHARFLTNWVQRNAARMPRRDQGDGTPAPRRIFEGLDEHGRARYRA